MAKIVRIVVSLVSIVLVVVVAALVATYFMSVRPEPHDSVAGADAVVVLAGDHQRLPTAVAVAGRSGAKYLVISDGATHGWPEANHYCGTTQPYVVVCPAPKSDDTRGEARMIGALARRHGWKTIVVVSSNYQLRRAKILIDRCTTATVRVYSAPAERWSVHTWGAALLEWPKLASAEIQRSC